MPAGPSFTERSGPMSIAVILASELPNREVPRVFFIIIVIGRSLLSGMRKIEPGQFAVILDLADADIYAIFCFIRHTLFQNSGDERDHVLDIFGSARKKM